MSFLQGLFGPPDVAKLAAKQDVPGLIKALGYQKDWSVRAAAAQALGQIGDARSLEPLIVALSDSDKHHRVRDAVVEVLVETGQPAVAPLAAALNNCDDDVRSTITFILVKIGQPAIEPLEAALKYSNAKVRWSAASALTQLGIRDDPCIRAWHVVAGQNWKAAEAFGSAYVVEPLVAALKDSDVNVRWNAIQTLNRIGGTRATDALVTALKDSDPSVRAEAARGLGKLRGTCVVEPLLLALKDSDPSVRVAAATALGRIGDSRAGVSLAALLADGYVAVADELARIGVGSAEMKILEAGLKSMGSGARAATAKLIGQCGDELQIDLLKTMLKDGDPSVRKAAASALGQIGQRYHNTDLVTPLAAALNDSDWHVREAVISALGQIDDYRAVEPLISVIRDSNYDSSVLCRLALKTLRKTGWMPGNDQTGAEYWVACGKWSHAVRIGAPALEPLVAALKSNSRPVRQEAAKGLLELYRSGRLLPSEMQLILNQRELMAAPHVDVLTYPENDLGVYEEVHRDYGIGVLIEP